MAVVRGVALSRIVASGNVEQGVGCVLRVHPHRRSLLVGLLQGMVVFQWERDHGLGGRSAPP